jgi:hypothetical protein
MPNSFTQTDQGRMNGHFTEEDEIEDTEGCE